MGCEACSKLTVFPPCVAQPRIPSSCAPSLKRTPRSSRTRCCMSPLLRPLSVPRCQARSSRSQSAPACCQVLSKTEPLHRARDQIKMVRWGAALFLGARPEDVEVFILSPSHLPLPRSRAHQPRVVVWLHADAGQGPAHAHRDADFVRRAHPRYVAACWSLYAASSTVTHHDC